MHHGRSTDRETVSLEEVGGVDLVYDVIGGDIGKPSAALVRAGGTLVTIAGPPERIKGKTIIRVGP